MNDTVRSIERCFDILDLFLEGEAELSLAEISRRLQAPKSTVLTIVRTLAGRGVLALDPDRKVYRLGLGFYRYSNHSRQPVTLQEVARPHLEKLTELTGETSTLAVVEGHAVFYSCSIQGSQLIRYVVPVGVPRPLHCTASGKLALSELGPAAVKEYIQRTGLTRHTSRTITRPSALATELERIRGQGFSSSLGEISNDLFGVAAPIRDSGGKMIASVNLAGPAFRLGNRMPRLAKAVRETADAISNQVRQVGAKLVVGSIDLDAGPRK